MEEWLEKGAKISKYILALPIGILAVILGYYIGYWSNLFIASADSIYMKLYNFLYYNCINVFVMIGVMNYILPNHQFIFTIVISIIFCIIGFIGLGMNIVIQNVSITYIIGIALTTISFIIACFYTYKEYNKNNKASD